MPETTLSDFLSKPEIESLHRPAEHAVGLPGRAYGAEFYELERKKLFPRMWCAVGFASDIPGPGDAAPVDLAGWPLVLVRGKDGVIRAFHNICRHRAMRVVPEPLKGASALACPWHSWTYDLEGRLFARPQFAGERAGDDGSPRDGLGLKPVRAAQWLDLVFVNIDGTAAPFEDHIRPLAKLLAPLDLSRLERAEGWALDYPGNWKISVEGAVEEYHIPFGHSQLYRGVRRAHSRLDAAPRSFLCASNAREYADRRDSGVAMGLTAELPRILPPEVEQRTHFVNIIPTGILQTRVNHVLQGLFLPDGPERTRLVVNHYYAGGAATDPAYAGSREELVREWKLIFEQDIPFVRFVHENYQRRDAAGIETRFSPFWEANVLAFQRDVVEVLAE